MISYGNAITYKFGSNFLRNSMDSAIYQITKYTFGINFNVSKARLYSILGLENPKERAEREFNHLHEKMRLRGLFTGPVQEYTQKPNKKPL